MKQSKFSETQIVNILKEEEASIDQFEGNTAVLNVGEDERRMEAPRSSLPKGS